jgi:hypothetical protein
VNDDALGGRRSARIAFMYEDADDDEEQVLEGGNVTAGVVRIGRTVRRPMGPSSTAIHAFLRHLEVEGFRGSPRILGIDRRQREVLTFHPGTTIWPDSAELLGTDETLIRMASLARDFHRASATFVPPAATWWEGSRDPEGGSMLLHGDLAPWNVVADPGGWVIIDWDTVSPGRVEWELAYVLLTFVPLWHNADVFDDEVVRRLALFSDVYELRQEQLNLALSLVPVRCRSVVKFMRERAAAGDAPFLAMVEDGHDAHWLAGAEHVEARLPNWRRADSV